jgi:hypothetical protein
MKARAYYSDPEHNGSFLGRWIWIYRGKGYLELTSGKLRFSSRSLNLELNPQQVRSVTLGTFARTAKPIPLHFVDLGFGTPAGKTRHVYIVPLVDHRSVWLISVWRLNKVVSAWFTALNEWLAEPDASPNGGPGTPSGNSGASEGLPSMS